MKLADFVSKNFPQVLSQEDISAVENFELNIMTRGLKIGLFEVMGSRAFGVHRPDSDVDIRGFYCYSPEYWQGCLHQAAPETLRLTVGKIDIELQELSTFIRLLGRGNQNNLMVVSKMWNKFHVDFENPENFVVVSRDESEFVYLAGEVAQNISIKSIEGQMRSDVFDLLRIDRTEKNLEKTCKNLIKLSYLRHRHDNYISIFDEFYLTKFREAIRQVPVLTKKIQKIRATALITNSKDLEQVTKASEALKDFWPDGLLGADKDIMSRIAAGTWNEYSESGSGKLESNQIAEMKMNTEIRKMVWEN